MTTLTKELESVRVPTRWIMRNPGLHPKKFDSLPCGFFLVEDSTECELRGGSRVF